MPGLVQGSIAPSPSGDLISVTTVNRKDGELDVILISAKDGSLVRNLTNGFDKNYGFEVFNLGAGRCEDLMDFVHTIERVCGKEGEKEFLPMQQGDVVSTAADISLAARKLGYEPGTMVPDGVPKFVSWYREYYGI